MAEKKILIVDADVASRNFVARTLTAQNYEVVQAGSAKEGLIFAWRDRPDLMIVDPTIPDLRGEELAAKLRADPRTAHMPLIALSPDTSVARLRACLDAGFNEYIEKSGQAVEAIIVAVNHLLGVTSGVAKQGGLLLVFVSAKGGVGTSSLCANLAMNVYHFQPQSRVAVIDMVLPIGSIAPIVGTESKQNIVTYADMPLADTGPEFFRDELKANDIWHLHLLPGAPDPETSNHLNVARIWDIVAATKLAFDYVFVDLGRSLSKISLPIIQHADLLTLIVSTDMSSVNLTKTLLDYLHFKGVKETAIYTILNRAIGLEGVSKTEAEKVLGIPIKTAIPYLGSNFALANNQHQPYSLKFPKDSASVVLMEAAKEMCTLAAKLRQE